MSFFEIIIAVSGIFGCEVVMAGTAWLLGLIVLDNWPNRVFLIEQSLFGVAIYTLLIHLFNMQAYNEVRSLLMEQWHKKRLLFV